MILMRKCAHSETSWQLSLPPIRAVTFRVLRPNQKPNSRLEGPEEAAKPPRRINHLIDWLRGYQSSQCAVERIKPLLASPGVCLSLRLPQDTLGCGVGINRASAKREGKRKGRNRFSKPCLQMTVAPVLPVRAATGILDGSSCTLHIGDNDGDDREC